MSSMVIAAVIFCCFSGGQDVGRAAPIIRVCDGISVLPAKTDYAAEIAANRKGKLTVTVTDSEGTPMPGMKLRWRLVERRFHFGCFSNLYNPAVMDKVKGMGCDFTTVHFNWQATEPEEGKFDWERIDFRCNPIGYSENGFLVKAHALVWLHAPVTPDYLKAKSFPEMKKAVRKHVEVLVLHYRDAVDIWNVINEPSASWTNIYAFSDAQIIELIKIACDVVRKRDPSARIIINNGSPIVKFYESGESPLDFLKECAAAGVDYDIVGLQCYYGPYTSRPGEDKATLQDLSDMADAYSELGKEVHITEFSVPSTKVEGRAAWTEKKQADWAEAAYKVFFSKPAVKAITWWNATDRRSFIESGALLREDGKPKKAYKRLKKLITKDWYTSGKGVTDAGGSVGLQGFGGRYEIMITDPSSGLSTTVRSWLFETKERNVDVLFDTKKIEKEIAKADKELNKKIEKRLGWMEDLTDYWESQGGNELAEAGRSGKDAVEALRQAGEYDQALKKSESVLEAIAVEKVTVLKASEFDSVGDGRVTFSGETAQMCENSALFKKIDFVSRKAEITIRASGDWAKGKAPLFVVSIGCSHSNEVFLKKESLQDYKITLGYEPGEYELRILYANDYYNRDEGADRNLYVDSVAIEENSWVPPE